MESNKNLSGSIEEEDSGRYIILVSQLEKSIQAFDSLHKCAKLCKEINEMSHKIGKIDFSIIKERPFPDTNVVIFTCKYGRGDILNYILSEDSNILFNATERIGISVIHPDDRDAEEKNAFYYSMKSLKTDLLELLIEKWQQGLTPEQLDKLLSSALNELKLRNVSISTEVEIYVESRLVELRFYEPAKPNQPKQKRVFNPKPVLQRIDLVLEKIEFALGLSTPGASFLCALKQIAVSVHVLKRQLRPTYDSIPWEEIEFYLATFIGCDGEPRELSMFLGSALSKRKILQVLGHLSTSLSYIKRNSSSVLTGKFLFPKLTREEMKKSVMKKSPFSEEFYDDFENLRDFVTLETVSKYMRIATTVDAKDYKGKVVLTRCLQVIGEHLKNTVESPKLSQGAADVLLSSLPIHTAEVLKKLRDALSHDHALEVRAELEENTHAFFERMQKDMQKLAVSVEAIKYRKKVSRVRKLLKAITRCDTVPEMRNIVEAIDITRIQDIIKERSRNVEVERVEFLVHALRSRLKETTNNEDSLFTDIERLLRFEKDKLEGIKADFAKVHSYLSLIVLLLQGDSESHEIRKWAHEAMSLMSPEKSLPYLSKVKVLLSNLWNSISPRLGEEVDEVLQIAFELSHVLEFDLVSVRWIHEFRNRLDKESGPVQKKKKKVTGLYDHLLTKKTKMLRDLLEDNHLREGRLHETITEYRKDEKLQALVEMLLLDIMSIFQSNGRLSENPYFLDNPHPLLLGQNLRKHLAHENALVRELADVDMDVLLVANTVVSSASNAVDLTDKVLKNDPLMLMDTCSVDLKVVVQNQTRLFEALEEGKISLVRECVKNGADIHGRDLKGRTALYFVSSVECARFVVKSGVKQESCDQFGCTALHSAALNGRADVVTYMIDQLEMGVDCRDNFLNTPLHLSAEKGHSAVVKALLERGGSTGAVDAAWNTPLHSAVGSGQLQTAKLLLNEEVHADAGRNIGGFTPLHISAEKGFKDLVKYLLDIGAEVDLGTDDGFTALHRACLTGRVEVVKVLLSRGAKVSALSVSGLTPAHLAAKNGHCSVLSLLCQKGCKLNYKDKIDGRTPLHLAAINGHNDAVSLLLEKGSNIGKKDMHGRTPLHLACFFGSEAIVKKHLESGASVDVVDEDGTTPLLVAVCKGSFDIVKLLLEHGADPNAIHHKRKCSALHIACVYGSKTIVQLLIERGSLVDAKDGNGETPLTLSIMSRYLDIVVLLMQGGADIHKKNDQELDALSLAAVYGLEGVLKQLVSLGAEADPKSICFACASGSLEAVQFLLGCGLDVNSTVLGSTPLHKAVRGNHKELVKLLISLGADPKSKNQNEYTPMLDAVKLNFKDVVEELLRAGAEVDMDLLIMAVNHGGELMEVLLKDRSVDLKEETILLHAACRAGMKSAADVLLSRGVPVNCVDDKKVPLLLSSVVAKQHDIVDYLLSKEADPDAGPDDQTTPLLSACVSGHVRTVAALIRAGCRVNENVFEMTVLNGHLKVLKLLLEEKCVTDAFKKRLFRIAVSVGKSDIVKHMAKNGIEKGLVHLAALNGHLDLLTFFLKNRLVDVNERTETGETILQYAAYGKHLDLIEPLLNFGAELDGTDAFGSTPAHVTASQRNAPFLKLLLQRGAVHDLLNFRGLTPLRVAEEGLKSTEIVSLLKNTYLLFEAVKKKDLKRTKDLLTKGAVSNASARDGSTPLHLASWKGSRDVVTLLLENGADPNTKGKGGSTPLHYAAKHGHIGVVVALLMGGAQFESRSESIKTPLNLSKRPSQVSDLLDQVHRSFRAVKNGECNVIQELKRGPSEWIKAILRCRDSENRTLVVTAIRHDFPRMNLLKNLIQTDDKVEQIVTTLRAVQDFTRLMSVLRSLLNARSISFGPDSPFVLDVKEEIALASHQLGQHNEALSDLKYVLQKRIETVGMGDDILRTQRNVAFMLFLQDKYAESVRVYRALYRKQLQIFGPVDADAVRSLLHIAMNTFAMRKYDEAVTKCDELMEVVKIQKDSAYLQALSVKASALQMKKDLDGALVLFKKVHEKRKRVLGHGHPETVTSLNNIMSVLKEQGKHLQALTVCKDILDAQSSSAIHKPPEILKTFASLGKIFMNLGLHFEAYKTFKTILKRGYQDDEIKHSAEVLEVRYAFVFPKGGIEGVLKEPTGVFEQGGDLRQMDAAELRRRDSMGRTALHHCVMTGDEAGARLLLRRGVEVLMTDHRGENPLHLATRLGRHNMAEILFRHVRLSSPWVLQS